VSKQEAKDRLEQQKKEEEEMRWLDVHCMLHSVFFLLALVEVALLLLGCTPHGSTHGHSTTACASHGGASVNRPKQVAHNAIDNLRSTGCTFRGSTPCDPRSVHSVDRHPAIHGMHIPWIDNLRSTECTFRGSITCDPRNVHSVDRHPAIHGMCILWIHIPWIDKY